MFGNNKKTRILETLWSKDRFLVKFDIVHIICILIMLDALWHSIKVFISNLASFLLYPYFILIV